MTWRFRNKSNRGSDIGFSSFWQVIAKIVASFFEEENGFIFNKRLEKVKEELTRYREEKAKAGKKGGKASGKAMQEKAKKQSIAQPLHSYSTAITHPITNDSSSSSTSSSTSPSISKEIQAEPGLIEVQIENTIKKDQYGKAEIAI